MAHNPRYRNWTPENWRGYAPTIGDIADQGWLLTAHCGTCGLAVHVDAAAVIRRRGRTWSPWGVTSPCVRIGCHGRMRFMGKNGKADGPIYM